MSADNAGEAPAAFPPNFYVSPAEPPPSADLDLSQFEGMIKDYRIEPLLKAAPSLIAEVKRLREENAAMSGTLEEFRASFIRDREDIRKYQEQVERLTRERDERLSVGELEMYKDQWKRHYEGELARFEVEKQQWFTQHLNEEADDLRAVIAELERDRERLVKAAVWGVDTLKTASLYLPGHGGHKDQALSIADKLQSAIDAAMQTNPAP